MSTSRYSFLLMSKSTPIAIEYVYVNLLTMKLKFFTAFLVIVRCYSLRKPQSFANIASLPRVSNEESHMVDIVRTSKRSFDEVADEDKSPGKSEDQCSKCGIASSAVCYCVDCGEKYCRVDEKVPVPNTSGMVMCFSFL